MTIEQAIDLLDNLIGMVEDNQENDYDTAFRMAIDALKAQLLQEGTTKDATSDLISRQQAIDALDCINGAEEVLRSLPSVQPEQKTVKCIIEGSCMDIGDADFSMKCAKCGAEYYHVEDYDYDYNFCPNCGRRWRRQDG